MTFWLGTGFESGNESDDGACIGLLAGLLTSDDDGDDCEDDDG